MGLQNGKGDLCVSNIGWEYRCVQTRGVCLSLGLTLSVSIKKFKCSPLIYVHCRDFYAASGNFNWKKVKCTFCTFYKHVLQLCSCVSSMRLQPFLQSLCCWTYLIRQNWIESAKQLLSRLLFVHGYIVREPTGVLCWTWEHCAFSWTPASSTKQWQNKTEISGTNLQSKVKKKRHICPAQWSREREYGPLLPEADKESWYCLAWFLLDFRSLKTSSPKDIATRGDTLPPTRNPGRPL